MRFQLSILFCMSFGFQSLNAQKSPMVLTPEVFIEFVKTYHPVAARADLLSLQGEGSIQKAKGSFDPYIHAEVSQKYFDDKKYFSLLNGGLKIPTWYGIELKTGVDNNTGIFVNPENSIPPGGLWYAGIKVPLGQGLVIDKRRAALKQAQIYAESTEIQKQKIVNNLFFDAIKQYWTWFNAWNQYNIYIEAVEIAYTRFNGIKSSYQNGDKPAIDTLEAFIQVQTRQYSLNESKLNFKNKTLELSNFLWYENNTPLEIDESVTPPVTQSIRIVGTPSINELNKWITTAENAHPEILLYNYKLDNLEIERLLKAEKLKPKLNLNYNALSAPYGDDVFANYSIENYKWGVDFNFPLFLREQRGDLQLAKIKIQDTELNQQQKLLEIRNKINGYYNEQKNLEQQLILINETVLNYERLLAGEKQKFKAGESSIFLVNTREKNLISIRLKRNELFAKYHIVQSAVLWATGSLYFPD
jgi:outer membrane protein TolC